MEARPDITVGFLGISHPHSSARFRTAKSLPGVTIVGAYDPDSAALNAFCDEVGTIPLDHSEMLGNPQVAAIFVHSKSHSMAGFGIDALDAGKHVLVEKPGGADLGSLRALARKAESGDLVARVGYNFHFSPALHKARDHLRDGDLGKVSLVRGHGASSRGEHLSAHLNQPDDMGGGLWVIGCHVLHLMVDLFGPPVAVRATVQKFASLSTAASLEDVASLTLEYPDKLGVFDFTVHENGEWFETSEVTAYGDRGQLNFGVLPGRFEISTTALEGCLGGRTTWSEGQFATPWTGPMSLYSELPQVGNSFFFDREVAEFLDAARGKPTSGGATALTAFHVAATIDAAYRSESRDGARVEVAAL